MRDGDERKADGGQLGRVQVLLKQVLGQHQDLGVWTEGLDSSEIADAFLQVLLAGHDFEDVERGPRHVVAEHFEVDELEQSGGLVVHVGTANLATAFLQAVLDVFFLIALVVPHAPDEGVEIFFEPGRSKRAMLWP